MAGTHGAHRSRGGILDGFLRDTVFGLRRFRKLPVFAIASILTLSVGIGMTTTMFTVLDSLVLTPLPGSNTEGGLSREGERPEGHPDARQ